MSDDVRSDWPSQGEPLRAPGQRSFSSRKHPYFSACIFHDLKPPIRPRTLLQINLYPRALCILVYFYTQETALQSPVLRRSILSTSPTIPHALVSLSLRGSFSAPSIKHHAKLSLNPECEHRSQFQSSFLCSGLGWVSGRPDPCAL